MVLSQHLDPGGRFAPETAARRVAVSELKRPLRNRYIIPPVSSWALGVFYTCFYNHARRICIKNRYLYICSRAF
jgi:hypothetical protein